MAERLIVSPEYAMQEKIDGVRLTVLINEDGIFGYNKRGEQAHVNTTLYDVAEALRWVAILLQPVMPAKMGALWQGLGQPGTCRVDYTVGALRCRIAFDPATGQVAKIAPM